MTSRIGLSFHLQRIPNQNRHISYHMHCPSFPFLYQTVPIFAIRRFKAATYLPSSGCYCWWCRWVLRVGIDVDIHIDDESGRDLWHALVACCKASCVSMPHSQLPAGLALTKWPIECVCGAGGCTAAVSRFVAFRFGVATSVPAASAMRSRPARERGQHWQRIIPRWQRCDTLALGEPPAVGANCSGLREPSWNGEKKEERE